MSVVVFRKVREAWSLRSLTIPKFKFLCERQMMYGCEDTRPLTPSQRPREMLQDSEKARLAISRPATPRYGPTS